MPSAVVKHGKKWGVVGMSLNVMFLYIKWQYWGIKGNIERIIWDIYIVIMAYVKLADEI